MVTATNLRARNKEDKLARIEHSNYVVRKL